MMAHTYSILLVCQQLGLDFFHGLWTLWGRPDMLYFIYLKRFWKEKPIQLFKTYGLI